MPSAISPDVLKIDAAREVDRITATIRENVFRQLRRKGAVIGVSGGVDSAVVAFLCARALGPERTFLLFIPETESSPDSLALGRMVASALGVRYATEDISAILTAAGCYERRDAAIRTLIPEYGRGYKCKLVLPDLQAGSDYVIFSIVVQAPGGQTCQVRLTADAYLRILAATNFKQRTRKMMEYHYADLLQYAVAGTPNRLEYDQGFFVKAGDGAADLKPIAHLYKSQVYQLAAYLGVPQEIQSRTPTTDTYSLSQSQEEFFFSLALDKLDLCLYGKNNGIDPEEIAAIAGLSSQHVQRAYKLIEAKRKATRYLHLHSLFVEPVPEIDPECFPELKTSI